eukprot:gb/GECG01004646.1/.p1 GENE.gb/GECG01004646.1/~~gb/GECG01004646.1/.p1  ORF type:complete len:181 (+),score=25.50 gb/GECG01004646.1/:1-543(+)
MSALASNSDCAAVHMLEAPSFSVILKRDVECLCNGNENKKKEVWEVLQSIRDLLSYTPLNDPSCPTDTHPTSWSEDWMKQFDRSWAENDWLQNGDVSVYARRDEEWGVWTFRDLLWEILSDEEEVDDVIDHFILRVVDAIHSLTQFWLCKPGPKALSIPPAEVENNWEILDKPEETLACQ